MLDKFKEEFERDYQAQEDQRLRANEDMRFVHVGQWEGWLEDEDRTRLEYDITSDYVDRFIGRYELNQVGVKYSPSGGESSDEDAELLTGLYLNDYEKGDGELSISNGIQEGVTCGYGAWRLITVPVDEEDPESDLTIVRRPLYSAYSTVVWDAGAKRQDKGDARHCTILHSFTRKGFEQAYPESETPVSIKPNDLSHFNWCSQDLVYVAERLEIERKPKSVFVFGNPVTKQIQEVDANDVDDIEDELADMGYEQLGGVRKIIERRVIKSIFHGGDFIEQPKRIPGKFIPVIPVYGKYTHIDGAEAYKGMVRGLKDPQRVLNLNISTAAEDARETNRDIPIFAPEQIDGLGEQFSKDLNKLPYIQLRPIRDANDNVQHVGPTGFLPQRRVDENQATLINLTAQLMDRKTGASFENQPDGDASGESKREARKDIDITTAHYHKGIKTAMRRDGQVYLSMAQEVHADKRHAKVMKEDGTEAMVNLLEHVADEETGLLVPVHDITRGSFEAVVKTGPQYESAREATVENLKDILTNLASGNKFEAPVMATLMANLPGVGLDELRELARREMLLMGMREPENEEEAALLQPQEDDGQAALIDAVTKEQETQAQKNFSEVLKNLSQADLNKAKALETRASAVDKTEGMKDRRMKMFVDRPQLTGA